MYRQSKASDFQAPLWNMICSISRYPSWISPATILRTRKTCTVEQGCASVVPINQNTPFSPYYIFLELNPVDTRLSLDWFIILRFSIILKVSQINPYNVTVVYSDPRNSSIFFSYRFSFCISLNTFIYYRSWKIGLYKLFSLFKEFSTIFFGDCRSMASLLFFSAVLHRFVLCWR